MKYLPFLIFLSFFSVISGVAVFIFLYGIYSESNFMDILANNKPELIVYCLLVGIISLLPVLPRFENFLRKEIDILYFHPEPYFIYFFTGVTSGMVIIFVI